MPDVITIVQERLPFHPLLGRNFRVDSRSLAYPFKADGLTLVSADHKRHAGPFDQGNIGSCTGNAAIGCMATDPYYATVTNESGDFTGQYALTEAGALRCYEDATTLDTYPGQYPPTDTGSDGTAVAQALKNASMISGYTHAADGPAARLALGQGPIIIGIKWFNSMFTAGSDGRMTVDRSSGLAGGHEIVCDAIEVEAQRVWFTQSWGPGWGVVRDDIPGRAYFTFDDFDGLIEDDGDATVFSPRTVPAPVPVPVPPQPSPADQADAALWAFGGVFAREHHTWPSYKHLAQALQTWAQRKGFTS